MTMMWLEALGTMHLPITRAGEAPSARAPTTYSIWRSCSTLPRTWRASRLAGPSR